MTGPQVHCHRCAAPRPPAGRAGRADGWGGGRYRAFSNDGTGDATGWSGMIAFTPGLDPGARGLAFERVGPDGGAALRAEVEFRR